MLLTDQILDKTHDRLLELGLRRRSTDVYADDDVMVVSRDGWLTLHTGAWSDQAGPDVAELDRPGLWKTVTSDETARRVFDVPLAVMLQRLDDTADVTGPDLACAAVTWALETRDGDVGSDWQPPAPDELSQAAPPAALSFRWESLIQQAGFTTGPGMLTLQVTIGTVDADLSAARRGWIEHLLIDASRLRMARLGLRPGGNGVASIEACINLSGAPTCVRDVLVPVAVDALRSCFSLVVSTATFLGDTGCASRALYNDPHHLFSKESK